MWDGLDRGGRVKVFVCVSNLGIFWVSGCEMSDMCRCRGSNVAIFSKAYKTSSELGKVER